MPVSITWSSTSGGSAITELDHGSVANGARTTVQQIFLSHDGSNAITSCAFYFQQRQSGYDGGASAAADFAEIKGWGDETVAADFGGAQVNMDPDNNSGYDNTTWDLDESTKQTGVAFTMNTGLGDSSTNAVTLDAEMAAGMTTDGEIPAGVEVSFLARFQVPTNEDTTGVRQLDQVLKYTYTS